MKLRRDSLLHAETSALLCIVFALVLPVWLACILAFLTGIGKEAWDTRHDGVATWADVFWDAVGVMAGAIITIL